MKVWEPAHDVQAIADSPPRIIDAAAHVEFTRCILTQRIRQPANWSVEEVRSFLGGATLGAAALQDAAENPDAKNEESGLWERFKMTVLPYLAFLQRAEASCESSKAKRQKIQASTELGEERLYRLVS
ncbi:hypothetical protein ACHAXT_000903 [Thalassiosira profunda]